MSNLPEVSHPSDGILAKIEQARHHYRLLDDAIGAYFNTRPRRFVPEKDPETGAVAFRFVVTNQPSVSLPLVIGDCLHNLRASLEYLAWQLVIAAGNQPSILRPATQFPILRSRRTRPVEIHPGIDRQAQIALDQVQPYNRTSQPEAHPLAVLDELAKRDRHRTLNLTSPRARDPQIDIIHPDTGRVILARKGPEILRDGDIAAMIVPGDYGLDVNPNAQTQAAFFVAFEEPGPWDGEPILRTLRQSLDYIEGVVLPKFAPCLT